MNEKAIFNEFSKGTGDQKHSNSDEKRSSLEETKVIDLYRDMIF